LLETGHKESANTLVDRFPELVPPSRGASALVTALAMSPPDAVSATTQQAWVQRWQREHPQDAELQFCVANLSLMRGDYLRAVELLRQCRDQNPEHLTTLNNLALALALGQQQPTAEAFELLQSAITQAGRQPLLMDTLAVLYLRQGAPQSAVDVLLAALPDATADGLLFLHLSQAWLDLGQDDLARYAFGMARSREVDLKPLVPEDRQMLQRLRRQFNL
jgi:predicted Zn-dependent protease